MGVPWPRGVLEDSSRLLLADSRGHPQLLQRRVLERWPDGSIRWLLLDWLADTRHGSSCRLYSSEDAQPDSAARGAGLVLEEDEESRGIRIDTGKIQVRLGSRGGQLFDSVRLDGSDCIDPSRTRLRLVDVKGREAGVALQRLEILDRGPVRGSLCSRWHLVTSSGSPLLTAKLYYHFFAGSPTVALEVALCNPRRAGHRRGRWSLGSRGSVYLQAFSVHFASLGETETADLLCSCEPGDPLEPVGQPLSLYQGSSGGENWRCRNHVNRHGVVPLRMRGYRLVSGPERRESLRATPIVAVEREGVWMGVTMRHFWQNFPKSFEVSQGEVSIGLFPRQFEDLHEIQGGEQKTHTLHVAFARDRVTPIPLDWCRYPLIVHADAEWYSLAEAVPYLVPRDRDPNSAHHALIDSAIHGDQSFERKREIVDEYGWRNFGDLYADHESVFHDGPEVLVSHANNQYDAAKGAAIQFLRTCDSRWFAMMEELARHVVDIDQYHTDRDKSAYNHGLFWHTDHYTDAGTSTHRSYPPGGSAGGGPASGNLYTHGLLLHHLLTGSPQSRDAVLSLGRYVIEADMGEKTVFRLLDKGPTGHVSESGFDHYHGPGRSPANAIGALLDAFRLSADRRFLEKAEELIRRCIHPCDDIAAREMENIEDRWFYTLFLQSLGRYLKVKEEREELDLIYYFARQSLLHYARWAADNERPYLESAEVLEYPTETWAAQDMRKSEVFHLASQYAGEREYARFKKRARFFFDYSVGQLSEMETRHLCRPVVLMMTNGQGQRYFDLATPREATECPYGPEDFGEPAAFESQKARALRRARRLVLVAGIALLTYAIVLLLAG